MKIVYDLDGVLRSLYPIVRRQFGLWCPDEYFDWDKKGYNIYDMVKKDYSILTRAKPTKYVRVINNYLKANKEIIEIWSWQPQDWITPTSKWIRQYIPNHVAYWLKPPEKYSRLLKEKDTILVDDYPNHPNYDKIWLIDAPYNKNVKCKVRISTVQDLRDRLKELKNG